MSRILAIVAKDLKQIARNRFVATISLLIILIYPVIYYLLPQKVDAQYELGFLLTASKEFQELVPDAAPDKLRDQIEKEAEKEEGLKIVWADSEDELRDLVEKNEVQAGFKLNLDLKQTDAVLFVNSRTPEEISEAGEIIAREIVYAFLGQELPVEIEEEVIGPDLLSSPLPLRDKLRILFFSFVFLLEIYALGSLIIDEIQKKTINAVLVSPTSLGEFVAAKTITGTLYTFIEAILVAALLGAVNTETILPIVVFSLLGGFVVVGIAFLCGAISYDIMSLTVISMLPLIVLVLPALVIVFPTAAFPALKYIPTYHVVIPLDGIINYGISFSEYASSTGILALWGVAFMLISFAVLRRRVPA